MIEVMVRGRIMHPGLSVSHCCVEGLSLSQLSLMSISIDETFLAALARVPF